MDEPLTEHLLEELLSSNGPATFADAHATGKRSLSDYLNQLLDEKGAKRAEVIKKAGMNSTYGYQIFVGQRNPSRNKVLQLAFSLSCTLREANRLLKVSDHSPLYPKDRRDAIIIFCIDRGRSLMQTNAELFRFGEDIIE